MTVLACDVTDDDPVPACGTTEPGHDGPALAAQERRTRWVKH